VQIQYILKQTSKFLELDVECKFNYSVKTMKYDRQKIADMRESGFSYDQIAAELDTTRANISSQISMMKKQGWDITRTIKWTSQHTQQLVDLRGEGRSNLEIAELLKVPHERVKKEASKLIQAGVLESIRAKNAAPTRVKKLPQNYAVLYLLYFPAEDFYKVGLTTNDVATRFAGSPDYVICDEYEDEVRVVVELEREILHNVRDYKYVPESTWFLSNGATECFLAPNFSTPGVQSQQLKLSDLI